MHSTESTWGTDGNSQTAVGRGPHQENAISEGVLDGSDESEFPPIVELISATSGRSTDEPLGIKNSLCCALYYNHDARTVEKIDLDRGDNCGESSVLTGVDSRVAAAQMLGREHFAWVCPDLKQYL